MHRFIRVRGKQNITLKIKGLAIWTGSSSDFAHVIYALQEYHSHIRIDFCPESAYSDKGRKPRLPLATKVKEYEELHWQPIVIVYKE